MTIHFSSPKTQIEHNKAFDLILQLHDAIEYPPISREEYDKRLKNAAQNGYTQLLFIEDKTVKGLLGYRILDDLLRPRRFFIDDLVVDKSHRKQGIAQKVLEYAYTKAYDENCARIDLEAALTNEAAIQLYQQQKFNKVAYLMKKAL